MLKTSSWLCQHIILAKIPYLQVEKQSEKLVDLVNEVSSGVEQFCQCPFPSDLIIYERLTCVGEETHVVVFQGWINSSNATHLAGLLEEWASSEPTVVVQDNKLQVVNPESQQPSEEHNIYVTVGLSASSVVVLLVLFAATIVCIILICQKRRHKR